MTRFALEDPQAPADIEAAIPLGRVGEPDEIAAAVIYLTSPAGRSLTRTTLTLDGGMTGCA
jgi:NAD(P)-dependent dehydrogenase (short-subunit alcohol dehydrogenase family)